MKVGVPKEIKTLECRVGVRDEGCVGVGVDVDGNAANSHRVRAADHAPGDLAPVCNEERREAHSRNTP